MAVFSAAAAATGGSACQQRCVCEVSDQVTRLESGVALTWAELLLLLLLLLDVEVMRRRTLRQTETAE